jgi:hypothetical protein
MILRGPPGETLVYYSGSREQINFGGADKTGRVGIPRTQKQCFFLKGGGTRN